MRIPFSFRSRMAACATLMAGVVAGLAPLVLAVGGPLAWAAVGFALTLLSGLLSWLMLGPLRSFADAATARLSFPETELPPTSHELATLAHCLEELEQRLAELHRHYDADLQQVSDALSSLHAGKTGNLTLEAPNSDAASLASNAFAELTKGVTQTRQQLRLSMRILQGSPQAIVVTEPTGTIRFVNPAAEKLFGVTTASAVRKPFHALLGKSSPAADADGESTIELLPPEKIGQWLATGPGVRLTMGRDGKKEEFPLLLTSSGPQGTARDLLVCLVAADLRVTIPEKARDRAAVRARVSRQVVDRTLEEIAPTVGLLAAQHRLLLSDAKQSNQRDSMLPRFRLMLQGINRLDVYGSLLRWFSVLTADNLEAPTPSEFLASELLNAISEKLRGRFGPRNQSLRLVDHGGWLFIDSDRLEAMLTGVLVHVSEATSGSPIEVHIRRMQPRSANEGAWLHFVIPDAGAPLSPQMLRAIEEPFGGIGPASLDRFDQVGGCPLGLIVARWLAPTVGGEVRFGTSSADQLIIEVIVPTQLPGTVPLASDAPSADVAPYEETVAGWRLGFVSETGRKGALV